MVVAYGTASAAPHPPCRDLLPVNGEKKAAISAFANRLCGKGAVGMRPAFLLPVYGVKVPEGRMRGSMAVQDRSR